MDSINNMPVESSVPNGTWNMGLGQYKWVANAGFAGLVAVLFAGLIVWGAHATTNQAVEAHKATNDLYMEIARQSGEREKLHREESMRMWQAIGENTRINLKTQELMLELTKSTRELTEEVRQIKETKNGKKND